MLAACKVKIATVLKPRKRLEKNERQGRVDVVEYARHQQVGRKGGAVHRIPDVDHRRPHHLLRPRVSVRPSIGGHCSCMCRRSRDDARPDA